MEDISAALSFEVKKEIADRYFRFRKIIEEDTFTYKQKVIALSLTLEDTIGFDLVCIYSLLKDDDLIHLFFELTGIAERFFFECDINTSPALRKKILRLRKIRGLTKKARFVNMFFDCYASLRLHIDNYGATFEELSEEHDVIKEQINLFYKNNDINTILQFLRGLDGHPETGIDQPVQTPEMETSCNLDEKLRLYPPDPVQNLLPDIPAIPPMKAVHTQMKNLIYSAWDRQEGLDLRHL